MRRDTKRLTASDFARYWPLDPDIDFLNHGSFGATPWPVLHAQSEWRTRMERDPVQFLAYELESHLDVVRGRLGGVLHADPDDLALIPNATTGVNTVLRSLDFQPGDEILATDHDYNACLNVIRFVASKTGAVPVVAHIPFPPKSDEDVIEPILAAATREHDWQSSATSPAQQAWSCQSSASSPR